MPWDARGYKVWYFPYRSKTFVPDDNKDGQYDIVFIQTPGTAIIITPGLYHRVLTRAPNGDSVDLYGSVFDFYDPHIFALRFTTQRLSQHGAEINDLVDEAMSKEYGHCNADSTLTLPQQRRAWAKKAHIAAVAKEGGNQRRDAMGKKRRSKIGMPPKRRKLTGSPPPPAVDSATDTASATAPDAATTQAAVDPATTTAI